MTINNGQDWQLMVALKALLVVIMLAVSLALAAMFHDIGKESKELEILSKCKGGQLVEINGLEIHCGVVSKELNIEAAQYRAVKNCSKLIKGWESE